MQMDKTHNSPECLWKVESIQPQGVIMHSDWYVRMSTDPPPVNTKVEMLPELCEEEEANMKQTFPVIESQLPY